MFRRKTIARNLTFGAFWFSMLIGGAFSFSRSNSKPVLKARPGAHFGRDISCFASRYDIKVKSFNTAYQYKFPTDNSIEQESKAPLEWIEIEIEEEGEDDDVSPKTTAKSGQSLTLPIYPLEACYLPFSEVNHTLINIDPRNIQMALDLSDDKIWPGRCFCVSMRALDTGHVARVGTVMRLLDSERQYNGVDKENPIRIVVQCEPQYLVNVEAFVKNPQTKANSRAFTKDYLTARVSPLPSIDDSPDDVAILVESLVTNYESVKQQFIDGTARDFPEFAKDSVGRLPSFDIDKFLADPEYCFWHVAQMWQTVCYTVREGKRIMLTGHLNEKKVAAASLKGGPLNLPVHSRDLPLSTQEDLYQMEMEAIENYWDHVRLDPCREFQCLIATESFSERLRMLGKMIMRERQRLEGIPSWMDDELNDSAFR